MTNQHNITNHSLNASMYKKLLELIPDLTTLKMGEAITSKSSVSGDLDLHLLDKLDNEIVIALAQYDDLNFGDFPCEWHLKTAAPFLMIRILPNSGIAEAIICKDHYQQSIKSQDDFLNAWLSTFLREGHKLTKDKD